MHADMEIHRAAKLSVPHLRAEAGTGARSALNNRLCAISASTSGALTARPDGMEFMLCKFKLTRGNEARREMINDSTRLLPFALQFLHQRRQWQRINDIGFC